MKGYNKNSLSTMIILFMTWLGLVGLTLVATFSIGDVVESADATEINTVTKKEKEEKVIEPKPVESIKSKQCMIVEGTGGLNIRKEPNMTSEIIGIVYEGEIILGDIKYLDGQVDETIEWIKIGNDKFVSSEYVKILEKELDLNKFIKTDRDTYIKEVPKPKVIVNSKSPVMSKTITVRSNLDITDVNNLVKGTKLEGIEQAIIDVEAKYGINGFFTYAVAALESGYGKSPIARDKNNLFGMNAEDSDPYNKAFRYDSLHSSIMDFGKRIKKYYVNKGRTTLSTISPIYSTDTLWESKVFNIMQTALSKIN